VHVQTAAIVTAEVPTDAFDFDAVFHAHYRRIARTIFRIIQDPSRAEELAVEVFCKLWRQSSAHRSQCGGWLYRTATRLAIDELRRRSRREKYERWFAFSAPSNDPERAQEAVQQRTRIRTVLATLRPSDAQLVVLRAEGFSYEELARTLNLQPASIGTMLRRAQTAFRKEYVKRYGEA